VVLTGRTVVHQVEYFSIYSTQFTSVCLKNSTAREGSHLEKYGTPPHTTHNHDKCRRASTLALLVLIGHHNDVQLTSRFARL
jgi:hypothetical protein